MSAPKKDIPELTGNKYYASNVFFISLPDMLFCNIINFSEAKNNNLLTTILLIFLHQFNNLHYYIIRITSPL